MTGHTADYDAETLAGLIEDEIASHVSTGTSGRLIVDYGVTVSDLADAIVRLLEDRPVTGHTAEKTRDPVEWALAIQAEYERAEREDDEFRTENTRPIPPGRTEGSSS